MAGADAAMLRAARRAYEEAKRYGHTIPVWRDGEVVELDPDVALAELDAAEEERARSREQGQSRESPAQESP